jgi:PEGA domain
MKRSLALALTIALVCWLCGARPLVAKGSGGHGGGGHSSRSAASRGSTTGGTHSAAAASRGAGGASHPTAATAHLRGDRPIVGTAVPRSGSRDLFLANPSTYAPIFIVPYRPTALGFRGYVNLFVPAHGFGYPYVAFGDEYAAAPPPSEAPEIGNLRLDVEPISAQIFVDGFFVGTVEDLYHTLAGLSLTPGPHHLELRAPGYETAVIDVKVDANRTITYRTALKPK